MPASRPANDRRGVRIMGIIVSSSVPSPGYMGCAEAHLEEVPDISPGSKAPGDGSGRVLTIPAGIAGGLDFGRVHMLSGIAFVFRHPSRMRGPAGQTTRGCRPPGLMSGIPPACVNCAKRAWESCRILARGRRPRSLHDHRST